MTLTIELEPKELQILETRAAELGVPIERAAADAVRDALQADDDLDAFLDERDAKRMAEREPVALEDCYTLDDLRKVMKK